ncbi:unnamed protein product [Larinioides sclopetarius]|uniref:Uncharacterized protein n=1 Tax=Larinioides sclopetarius TaxID=280406 RepID=A0AAV1Z4L9_9ARAC
MLYGELQLSREYLITNCYEYLSWITFTFLKVLTVCVAQYDQSWFLCQKTKINQPTERYPENCL